VSCTRQIALSALVLLGVAIYGCGGPSSSEVVARVGDAPIAKASLTHWITVLKGGPSATTGSASSERALRREVLGLLISSRWLLGEAARHGISISRHEVRQQIGRVEQIDLAGGTSELSGFLKSTGETVADLELRAEDELASAKLRRLAIASVPSATEAQVAAYYSQHTKSFMVDGRREARFINRKSRAAAEKVKQEVEAGKSLTPPERRRVGEVFEGAHVPPHPGNEYEEAIDASPPHKVSGPYPIGNDFWLYEVVRVIPAHQKPLSEVASAIRRRLTRARRRAALAGFVDAWRTQWTAKTDCMPGYVVSLCRQYAGPAARDDPFGIL
jgi:hypothetical protein